MCSLVSASRRAAGLLAIGTLALAACNDDDATDPNIDAKTTLQNFLPSHEDLRAALQDVVKERNGGLGFNMWAVLVDRDGFVVEVVFSGENRADEWPASRAIAAQKANTANGLSLDDFALATANLFAAVQPGGSLFGLQESNPVDHETAYGGKPEFYGTEHDPMIGRRIGGINVFGGGLALYSSEGVLLGGLGASGDTSCTDHIIAWKLRHDLNLDNVPGGPAPDNTDNIIFDDNGKFEGFEHPKCFDTEGRGNHVEIAEDLPETHPVGEEE